MEVQVKAAYTTEVLTRRSANPCRRCKRRIRSGSSARCRNGVAFRHIKCKKWKGRTSVAGNRLSPKYLQYINSAAWSERRAEWLDRNGAYCRDCDAVGKLDLHHLTYVRLGREQDEDLVSLCRKCHLVRHGH